MADTIGLIRMFKPQVGEVHSESVEEVDKDPTDYSSTIVVANHHPWARYVDPHNWD